MHDIRKISSVTDNPLVEDVLRKRETPGKNGKKEFEEELKKRGSETGEEVKTRPAAEKPSRRRKKKKVQEENRAGKIRGRVDIKV